MTRKLPYIFEMFTGRTFSLQSFADSLKYRLGIDHLLVGCHIILQFVGHMARFISAIGLLLEFCGKIIFPKRVRTSSYMELKLRCVCSPCTVSLCCTGLSSFERCSGVRAHFRSLSKVVKEKPEIIGVMRTVILREDGGKGGAAKYGVALVVPSSMGRRTQGLVAYKECVHYFEIRSLSLNGSHKRQR